MKKNILFLLFLGFTVPVALLAMEGGSEKEMMSEEEEETPEKLLEVLMGYYREQKEISNLIREKSQHLQSLFDIASYPDLTHRDIFLKRNELGSEVAQLHQKIREVQDKLRPIIQKLKDMGVTAEELEQSVAHANK